MVLIPHRPLALFVTMALVGCSASDHADRVAQDSSNDDGTATASDDQDSDESTGPGSAAQGDTDPSGAEDSTGSDPSAAPIDVPARAVTISLVEANSGVAVPIAHNGRPVAGSGRNAPLPKGRDTAIRVYLDVDDATWVPRPIEARVLVSQSDGTSSEYRQQANISKDSSTTSLQSNILVGIPADAVLPGAKFQVELFEAGDGWQDVPEATEPPRALNDGPSFIGIESADLNMRVVMVPVDYSYGSCSTTVELTEDALKPYEREMFQQNPLQTLEIEVREPISVTDLDLSDPNDFYGLLNRAMQLRAADSPDANVYYYVIFDNCGACIGDGQGCLLGVAPGTPGPTQSEASQRVAIGVRYLGNQEMGMSTFVHEIGHTQGRRHVACPNADAAGPDVSYPYAGGSIGVWGFGVRDFQIRNAGSHTDYMSYCSPTWVSDWQWSATYDRIKSLTQWDTSSVAPASGTMLVGNLNVETGESSWWTEPGDVDPASLSASHELTLEAPTGEIHRTAADVDHWSEGPWVTVRAPLPRADLVAQTQSFALQMPGVTHRVPRSKVRFDLVGSFTATTAN